MSTVEITTTEALESVTGYDEIAVGKHFGIDLYTGNESRPMTVVRALVFVTKRHEQMPDPEAKTFAMNLRMGELNDYFADEPQDMDPDEPDSDTGKDFSALA